jgi:hypothetical protein
MSAIMIDNLRIPEMMWPVSFGGCADMECTPGRICDCAFLELGSSLLKFGSVGMKFSHMLAIR